MAFYDEMAATALELLTEFGNSIVVKRETGAEIDPITGVEVAGVDASFSAFGVIKPYPDSAIDGERVVVGDKEIVFDSNVTPLLTDKPFIDGEYWSIVDIKTVSPAGIPVVYFVQVRR